jgi:hypothetical protein
MARKLKVTWQDGSWNRDGDLPIAEAMVPAGAQLVNVGDDTLVFKDGNGIVLAIPGQRLISVVEIVEAS